MAQQVPALASLQFSTEDISRREAGPRALAEKLKDTGNGEWAEPSGYTLLSGIPLLAKFTSEESKFALA